MPKLHISSPVAAVSATLVPAPLALSALVLSALVPAWARAVTLVQDGAPRATIVVAQSALNPGNADVSARKVNSAARDLQDYVKKMSGATLPLVGDGSNPAGALVLVGASRFTEALDIPAGLTPERNEEGFLLKSEREKLILAGNDAGPYHGTEYATYELLNRLGVRWFMPGEYGEVVPKRATVTVADISLRSKPDFRVRNWWLHTTPEMAATERVWKLRNKMNPDSIFATPTDGSLGLYVAAAELSKTRPELFAKNFDGTLNTRMPNLANPETVTIAADKVKAYFRAHPEATSLGMAPDDGIPRDFNAETVKRNQGFADPVAREGVPAEMSATEEWIEWVNAVTREVNREFPNHIITTNGYANRNMAPFGVPIDPHVSIMFAAIWSDTIHAYDDPKSWQMVQQGQILQQWTSMNDKVWIYNYDHTMLASALTPVPATRKLARDLPLMKKWGVAGFLNESRNVWAERGIAMRYLNARLMWDANLDVKALLADYYTQWYGAAARPAEAYWNALEDVLEKTPVLGHEDRVLPWVYTAELLAQLEKHCAAAERAAATPRDKIHVRADRLILEHLKAYYDMNQADLTGDYAAAARHGERMMQVRPELAAIDTFYILPNEKDKNGATYYPSGVFYWGIVDRIRYYKQLADKMSGKTGTLVALLPQRCAFTTDAHDEGRFAGWYRTDWNTASWPTVTTARPFYLQSSKGHQYLDEKGHPYLGSMWYQFKVDVPAAAAGKTIKAYFPIIESEAWVWVNGRYVIHRPYRESYERPNDLDHDITSVLHPGTNVITVRVSTGLVRSGVAGGLLNRPFLYTPQTVVAPTK